ncbi:hypothetical protein A5740_11290 [Mycobacterium sp. GA-1841]|uniref:chloramphenicol phosphotransferase CPT family protein n=1 Tax=Mycobacterium sp. GA-1841 TaxID=1834154 RepID=UPI00096DFC3F|nr:AAA family ATPase [Mycobacterium sp. GA-1841]OMC33867.1 hypothetical protein A5740_11290 [Mycobacterium sp. GA-1841]
MVGATAVGQVVLLNGVSSSGKSTLARQLLADFDTPWFHMGVDMFGAMRAEAQTHDLDEAGLTEVLRRTRAGFHRAVRGMALAGNNIVMDYVLSEPWRLADLLTVMEDVDVIFVGVHCDAAVLTDREVARGDRVVGTAVAQIEPTHNHGLYDVEVDTSAGDIRSCAARIREYLAEQPAPTVRAFHALRRRR